MPLNVQYGCGLSAPEHWINFDASPTLRLQRIPLFGKLVKKVDFPKSVKFGDITKKLSGIKQGTCDAIFCSHVLEHLSFQDFRIALRNSFELLKQGGRFRCVLPDLRFSIDQYIVEHETDPSSACINFLKNTLLGVESKPKSIKAALIAFFGNSHHLWMWDRGSLKNELIKTGFKKIRECKFNDSDYSAFKLVEDESRFYGAIAFESVK